MEKESPRWKLVEANSTGGQGSRRAVGGVCVWRCFVLHYTCFGHSAA